MPPPNRVPIADLVLVTPVPICVGQEVVVDASGTTDVDGPPNKIKNIFYWGQDTDKTTTPGKPGKAAYARGYDAVGVYDIVYEVIDHKGGKATATVSIDVQPAETVPVPVDCIPGTALETPGPWSDCQPNGTQTRTVTWVRTGDIPEQHGGAPCGPTTGSRVEEQVCVYVPPIEPPPSDGSYFENLKALTAYVDGRSWTQAELDASVPSGSSYIIRNVNGVAVINKPPRNTFSQHPPLAIYGDIGDEGIPGKETVRVPLSVGDGRLLLIWDQVWGVEFQMNRGLLDGLKTTFLFEGATNTYAVFRDQLGSKDQDFADMPPGGLSRHNMTMSPDYPPVNTHPPGTVSADPYNPTGAGAVPLRTFHTMLETRTRYILEVRLRRPGSEFTEWSAHALGGAPLDGVWDMVSVWVVDARGVARLAYRVPVKPLPADHQFCEWRFALNTSTTNAVTPSNPTGRGIDGPLIGALGPLAVLHNYTSPAWESDAPEQDLVIFQAP